MSTPKLSINHKSKVVFLGFHQKSSSMKGCIPTKVVFHRRSSSIKGHLLLKVVFHQMLSSIKICLPSKVVFHQRLSSIKGHLSKLSSIKGYLHQRLSSIKGHLPSKDFCEGSSCCYSWCSSCSCDREKTKSTPSLRPKPGVWQFGVNPSSCVFTSGLFRIRLTRSGRRMWAFYQCQTVFTWSLIMTVVTIPVLWTLLQENLNNWFIVILLNNVAFLNQWIEMLRKKASHH